jgi:hypothetical protein
MATDRPESSPAERAERLKFVICCDESQMTFLGRVKHWRQHGWTNPAWGYALLLEAADLLVSLQGQPLSRLECDPSLKQGGWDGYDAAPLSADALEQARAFLAGVSAVPTVAGGVQLEWHTPDVDIEIEFESGAAPFYYLHDRSTGVSLAIPDDEACQQASREQEREPWQKRYDAIDIALERAFLAEQREEAAEQQIKTLAQERDAAIAIAEQLQQERDALREEIARLKGEQR